MLKPVFFGSTDSSYLTPREAASILKRTLNTLKQWRYTKFGPTHYKIHGRIYYKKEDIELWMMGR